MFKCINLNKDNIIKFKELNKNSKNFNLLNEDFLFYIITIALYKGYF